MSKKVAIDENFFANWSPGMAWVLGVIFTDGYYGKANSSGIRRVYIAQKEPELLEKVKALMRSSHKIIRNTQTNKKGIIYYFSFTNKKIYNSLIKLGVHPKKSLTIKFPLSIPEDCLKHFLRGCWDSDGSFYYEYNDPGRVRGDYVSGSYEFINAYVEKIKSLTNLKMINIYNKHGKENCFYIKMTPRQTIKLFPLFYSGVREEFFLKEKYLKLKNSYEVLIKQYG